MIMNVSIFTGRNRSRCGAVLRRIVSVLPMLVLTAGGAAPAQAQKVVDPAKTPRVPIERRASIAGDASIRFGGAISSLRIIGWDRDSLVITGSMPKGWRFDGGVGSPIGGLGRGAKFFFEAPGDG